MKEKYIEECKIIQQNCTYTAEAHYQLAISAKRQTLWFEVIPAICAAVSSTLFSTGVLGRWALIITVVSSVVTAISTILNPSKIYQTHLGVAKNFTALKHDARFLHKAISQKLSEESFILAVEHLHQKYNELLKTAPPTNSKSFKKAQEFIKKGIHDPDKDVDGEIK